MLYHIYFINMNKDIARRLKALREIMIKNCIDAFIVTSTDPHSGEYIPEYWESRKWISGFTGSAGTFVITKNQASLWTDSRYFLQAEQQLDGTEIKLHKDGLIETPSIAEWLVSTLNSGDKIGIDGWVNSLESIINLKKSVSQKRISIVNIDDPFINIWTDRPQLPKAEIFELDLAYTGKSRREKIAEIKDNIRKNNSNSLLLSSLDEIAWTLNLRGSDVHCNPVFISYLLILPNKNILYTDSDKLSPKTKLSLKSDNIYIKPYESIGEDLLNIKEDISISIQLSPFVNYAIYNILGDRAHISPSPVALLKAIKNEAEIGGIHKAMIKDGIAMVKFLRWIKNAVKSENESEISISDKLLAFREEQDNFRGISFDTIAGYKEHGAIVHYEATPQSDIKISPSGMLLLDSGGQYLEGTTDITRTIILGPVSDEEKRDYTLVLKGMINLSMAHFPQGTCGTQLDALARIAMWKYGINYMHGTGHGVGCFLNVHEGPHQIRMNHVPTPLTSGMTVTNEPGIYKSGRYGIRTENTMLIVEAEETEFGKFYKFEPLTLCPIDKEAIDKEMLNNEEKEWFNNYHKYVFDKLSSHINGEDLIWLKQATDSI